MSNETEYVSYPCDEPEESGKSYEPGNDPKAAKASAGQDSTPDNANVADGQGNTQEEPPAKKGKGRRGGNAAASVVVHSGKFKGPRRDAAGADRRLDGTSAETRRDHRYPFERDENKGYHGSRYAERNNGRKTDRDAGRRKSTDNRGDGYRYPFEREESNRSRYRSYDKTGAERSAYANRRDRDGSRREPDSEAAFSRDYTIPVSSTSEIGAFVQAPEAIRQSSFGRHVGEDGKVLLPFAEQIGRPQRGDQVTVRFYEDKGGRLTATMRRPILEDGEVGILEVAAVTRIGAFLDNGMPKQVLLPFKEQLHKPEIGDEVLVWLYTDKSGRQAATMRVYSHLDRHSPYQEDDRVTGFVYEVNPELGVFIAVDNQYYGMVPIRETFKEYAYGDEVEARVARVREDGKLDLLIREKLYKTIEEDADVILYELKRNNGFLPYGDRADAAFIEETYAMSKNQFKRALGHLYKNRIVELDREHDTVRLLKEIP